MSMRCSPKVDSLGNLRRFKAWQAPSPKPLLSWLIPSTAWTELSGVGTDKFGRISQFTPFSVLSCGPSKAMSVSTDDRDRNCLCFSRLSRAFWV
jgi:hypothetical protein